MITEPVDCCLDLAPVRLGILVEGGRCGAGGGLRRGCCGLSRDERRLQSKETGRAYCEASSKSSMSSSVLRFAFTP